MATKTVTSSAAPADALRQGAASYFRLLQGLRGLPELVRPGMERGEDDSMQYDFQGAWQLVQEALPIDTGPGRAGFAAALARHLIGVVNGVVVDTSGDADEEAAYALDCVGDPVAKSCAMTTGSLELLQAEHLLEAIAFSASQIDRRFFYELSRFDDDSGNLSAERVTLELDLLRNQFRQMGWMAELGLSKLTGQQSGCVRDPGPEAWLLSPSYPRGATANAGASHD